MKTPRPPRSTPAPPPPPTPPPPVPILPLRRGRRRDGPHDDQIVGVYGKATLSPVKKGGTIVGYHITCRNHNDDNDPEGVFCEKTLCFGENTRTRITEEECRWCLKCWFIMGNDSRTPTLPSNPWEEGKYRSYHVKRYGGYKLSDFRSDDPSSICYGLSEAELDVVCECVI